jgi:transposase
LGRSRGGFSTKLNALVDTRGRPLHVILTPGNRHDLIAAPELLVHARGWGLIGDIGYDSNAFRAQVREHGMVPVIGSKPERPRKLPKRRALYAKRYLVERFFHSLKRFRALGTRYDKTAVSFLGLVHLCCAVLWLP